MKSTSTTPKLSTQQTEALEKFAALDGGRDPRAELFA